MSTLYLKIPALGESITEAMIGKWKRGVGEAVKADEPLVEVESDKATVEVPSPGSGVIRKIIHQSGSTVAIGEVIAEIEEGATAGASAATSAAAPAAPAPKPEAKSAASGPVPTPAAAQAPPSLPTPSQAAALSAGTAATSAGNGKSGGNGHGQRRESDDGHATTVKASPALRRMMAEQDITPGDVAGSGPAGRIERTDIERAVEARRSGSSAQAQAPQAPLAPPAPLAPQAPYVPKANERVVAMTPMRKTVARRLLEAQNTAAILTTFNEINMAEVIALRERYQEQFTKRHGIKLGFMSFFVKASVDALKAFPIVNAEVRGTDIIYKDHYDIGVAVGGGKGLVVPVVRNADRLSLAEVERAIAELAVKAKENRISLQELEGGTFTISNGGIYGSMMSTPILNPPQSGILGLHAIQKRPVAVGEAIALRPMMYVALSYDHRVVDGREAVQFLVRIKECIEDPERILIEV
jgi:2-oxoglutarate dehydrogenase E2 component (dihydrolipoamide succinyltransferase)